MATSWPRTPAPCSANWAKLKAVEKAEKGKHGALDGVPKSAPALLRATRTGEKAGAVGFDWPDAEGPRAKVDEELREFDEARRGGDRAEMQRELGDLLFATVNLARKLGLDAEQALRGATDRFASRFGHVERALAAAGARRRRRPARRAGAAVGIGETSRKDRMRLK